MTLAYEALQSARNEGRNVVSAVMSDPALTDDEKLRRVRSMIQEQEMNLSKLNVEIARDEQRMQVLKELQRWNAGAFKLERNDCSRLHKLTDAARGETILCLEDKDQEFVGRSLALFQKAHVFVVAHDWAAAFGEAIGAMDDEVILPYQHCVFEFRVSGKTIVCVAMQPEGGEIVAAWFIDNGGRWCFVHADDDFHAFSFVWAQVKAICVALDAEVATHDVVRAPAALNKKIERNGRCPVFDYHVVSLARRHRVALTGDGEPTGQKKRLHFRRGHWRHYEGHKTWIRWMLVGDPSLGFIDKHYSL